MRIELLLLIFAASVQGIPIDNGVEGEPEIECGPTSITVNFNTKNDFEGQVYVKGLYTEGDCRNEDGGRQVAGIELPFDSCNTRRQRSLNPKGVFVSTIVIISFHPRFITKVDRAYKIQCFYMEADKTVSTELEVSMLTTDFRTQTVPMPICRYELYRAGTDEIVEYAIVGEAIDHRWTCDTETINTFCMAVHSCFVSDTERDRFELIDFLGCATDLYLLNNPEYPTDLSATVEAHVFKFADRPQLYFECQINILVKEPNDECPRPNCPVPAGRGAGNANPRLGEFPANPSKHVWPVGPGPYTILEPIFGVKNLPGSGAQNARTPAPIGPGTPGFVAFRGKRSTENITSAGIIDVGATLDALEATSDEVLPRSLKRAYERTPFVQQSPSGDFCLSTTSIITFGFSLITVMVGLIFSIRVYIQRLHKHNSVYSLAQLKANHEDS